ncbi:hypothetical protein SAMN05444389_10754 [Paracoccus solventivorans]|uniref:Peptidoglycan-binding protein n=1 Tax=Paracoccus solventivorans TaxID=53463 RepID=A0A1M7HWD9_9RHOB|nr:hypothetical protein [Paracoccus solventivorans]SHM32804.1 hypothetical protein SAMN05444389_10754 [Paracoccus solventivorans]
MRRLGFLIVAMLPGLAWAEPVVLRVEAKRGPDTAAVVESWAARFPEVMTFPLSGGWTGIGLGPMEREDAQAEMARLKAAGRIPRDSFIVPVPAGAAPVTAAAGDADAEAPGADAEDAAVEDASPRAGLAAGDYLRLQRYDTRESADAALAEWRADFPEAGLWQQPDGGFAITLGPVAPGVGEAWLQAFRAAERVGRFAAVLPAADLGEVLDEGADPQLPPAGEAAMPPLDEVQRALRWAGRYDGEIDGTAGPQTNAAIAAEVLALRAAPDAGSAMQALIERRAAWRDEMGLTTLHDPQSGLSLTAPMDRLQFLRNEQGLSIYGPRNESGAALILYRAPGGQQEMLDFTGLVTALGWVPAPERQVSQGSASLIGRNDTHIGQAEARVVDGNVEGLVLIWPVLDADDQPRIAAEMLDSLRYAPVAGDVPADDAADGGAAEETPGTTADAAAD